MSAYPLHDRFRVRWVLRFLLSFAFFLVPAYIGLGRAGLAGWRTAWILGAAAFFGLVLPAILCCHCPHYAKPGLFIACPSIVGTPKIRRYTARPVCPAEKVLFAAGFILVLGFPVAVLMWVKSWVFALLTLAGAAIFFVTDQKCSCAKCLNFSCLLNRVPADIRKAWEDGGAGVNSRTLDASGSQSPTQRRKN